MMIGVHDDWREEREIDVRAVANIPQSPIAPVEIHDFVYGRLNGLRCLWLSSSDLPHGTGSGSPLHFRFRLDDLPRDAQIVIAEGVLKADVLYAIHPELYIVATPCVTANHGALVELTHGRRVLTAFDQDHYSNETVCFHLASLIARRLRRERALATTRIASWDASVKGIDDAVVRNISITSISVQRWLDRLSPRFRQIAMTPLSGRAEVPYIHKH